MAYLALILIVVLGVVAYVPGLPPDIAGIPLAPVRQVARTVGDGAGRLARALSASVREKALGLLRAQLHSAIDQSVK